MARLRWENREDGGRSDRMRPAAKWRDTTHRSPLTTHAVSVQVLVPRVERNDRGRTGRVLTGNLAGGPIVLEQLVDEGRDLVYLALAEMARQHRRHVLDHALAAEFVDRFRRRPDEHLIE